VIYAIQVCVYCKSYDERECLDTDSIIFRCPRGGNPIPEGSFLGEMSREYPDQEILEVVCAGPKQYALKLRQKDSGEITYSLKCRGITVDKGNEGKMNYEKFKDLTFEAYGNGVEPTIPNPHFDYSRIGPDNANRILTRQVSKLYRCVNTKGYAAADGVIYPYGFE
jgi:hypothetical protein